jgi:hypothetical protein
MTPEELFDRLWPFAARIAKVLDALPITNDKFSRELPAIANICSAEDVLLLDLSRSAA